MARVVVELNDRLPDIIDSLIDDLKGLITQYHDDFPGEDMPEYGDLDMTGELHELVDGAVPVYTRDIDTIWFLHKQELLEAYENNVGGKNPMEKDGMVAIYYLLCDNLYEWYEKEAEDFWATLQPETA